MAKIKNTDKNKCQWEYRTRTLIYYYESMNGTILKNVWQFLIKLNIHLTHFTTKIKENMFKQTLVHKYS